MEDKNYLFDQLYHYHEWNYYPMHMPGHKRNASLFPNSSSYQMDITEIDGFDYLHRPTGILKNSMERVRRLYQTKKSYFLINGSTVGILASIAACTKMGDHILMARNCHKSVYNAVFLNRLKATYIYPNFCSDFFLNCEIPVQELAFLLEQYRDIKLVIITSPTYEGIISNIEEIAQLTHKYGIPLIVDEAHGAHLGFSEYFPQSAIYYQADIVIHSVHKTLPALTQTALLHVNGDLINQEKLESYLSIYQTSSPSYLLMASIDYCMELIETKGKEMFLELHKNLEWFYKKSEKLHYLNIYQGKKDCVFDRSKLLISVKDSSLTSRQLYDIMREKYKIQLEMFTKEYVLAITTICDKTEGFQKLWAALSELDKTQCAGKKESNFIENRSIKLEQMMTVSEASEQPREFISLENCEDRVAGEYLYLYPPGIPLIVPGERFNKEIIDAVMLYQREGFCLLGLQEEKASVLVIGGK